MWLDLAITVLLCLGAFRICWRVDQIGKAWPFEEGSPEIRGLIKDSVIAVMILILLLRFVPR